MLYRHFVVCCGYTGHRPDRRVGPGAGFYRPDGCRAGGNECQRGTARFRNGAVGRRECQGKGCRLGNGRSCQRQCGAGARKAGGQAAPGVVHRTKATGQGRGCQRTARTECNRRRQPHGNARSQDEAAALTHGPASVDIDKKHPVPVGADLLNGPAGSAVGGFDECSLPPVAAGADAPACLCIRKKQAGNFSVDAGKLIGPEFTSAGGTQQGSAETRYPAGAGIRKENSSQP